MLEQVPYLTPAQSAERNGVSRAYVARLAQNGLIPGAFKVGRHWNIPAGWHPPADPKAGWPKGRRRSRLRQLKLDL
jgi:excisionase family DNA binding protein